MTARLLTLLIASLPLMAGAQTPDPLKAAAAEPGAVVTDSGLVFRSLKDGSGASPNRLDALVWALWWLCLEHAPIKPKTARALAHRAKGLLQPRS